MTNASLFLLVKTILINEKSLWQAVPHLQVMLAVTTAAT